MTAAALAAVQPAPDTSVDEAGYAAVEALRGERRPARRVAGQVGTETLDGHRDPAERATPDPVALAIREPALRRRADPGGPVPAGHGDGRDTCRRGRLGQMGARLSTPARSRRGERGPSRPPFW